MRLRRVAVSLLATGLLVGLAGCSDGEADETANDTGGDATTEAVSEAPAALTKESFAQDIIAAQVEAGSAHFEATIDAADQSFDISGDVGVRRPRCHGHGRLCVDPRRTAAVPPGRQDALPEGRGIAPEGKEWVKIDLTDSKSPVGKIFDAVNPSNFTAYLEGITGFEEVGPETVDGVETRHYTITSDTAKMLDSNPMFEGQDASTLGLPAELSSEVYVDSENRPVRIQVELGEIGSFDAHFSDYGKDVSVEAPDPSTVGEFSL